MEATCDVSFGADFARISSSEELLEFSGTGIFCFTCDPLGSSLSDDESDSLEESFDIFPLACSYIYETAGYT